MRQKQPDLPKAKSLLAASIDTISFTKTLPVTSHSSTTIIRNVYESFRMLGESILTIEGIESTDHKIPIQRLIKTNVNTTRSLLVLDSLRLLRHNINYRGYVSTLSEAKDALDIVNSCFEPLVTYVKQLLK